MSQKLKSGCWAVWLASWFVVALPFEQCGACARPQADEGVRTEPQFSVVFEQISDLQTRVSIDGSEFTTIDCEHFAKPVLHPVYGPGQIRMTREWPMRQVDGEANDHPHHKGIWFAHGDVNGVDFWAEKAKIVTTLAQPSADSANTFEIQNQWRNGDEIVCTDVMLLSFGAAENLRWIDFDIHWHASHGELKLGDTKEGLLAIRTHPDLRLEPDPRRGVEKVFGTATNSEGQTGRNIWGQAAKWVYYHGPIEGQPMAIMFLDHPQNFRHPTTWHAREYGLIAVNPFGLSDFKKLPQGTGDFTLPSGNCLRLRYRIIFRSLPENAVSPENLWNSYLQTIQPQQSDD